MAGLIGAAGSGESAEGTGETSRHSQSGLEPCWSNVPQLQLVSKLDSWWSSSSAVQVHLGDTGIKNPWAVPEAEGASWDCLSRLK